MRITNLIAVTVSQLLPILERLGRCLVWSLLRKKRRKSIGTALMTTNSAELTCIVVTWTHLSILGNDICISSSLCIMCIINIRLRHLTKKLIVYLVGILAISNWVVH